MAKRGFKFGKYDPSAVNFGWEYDTADEGWTLTSWEFPEPEIIENYIDVPGRLDGPLDVSTALTNGHPRYGQRTLTATFERSDGTRGHRTNDIRRMGRMLHGQRLDIAFPDGGVTSTLHAKGRIRVETLYNDPAHASVRLTATCDPWMYFNGEEDVNITSSASTTAYRDLINDGAKLVVPTIKITTQSSVQLWGGGLEFSKQVEGAVLGYTHQLSNVSLGAGTYKLPDFYIEPGETFRLNFTGDGNIKITYREAVF